jgi:hypothetical protein
MASLMEQMKAAADARLAAVEQDREAFMARSRQRGA